MSMSTWVKGIRDLDGQFAKMAAIKAACEEAKVDYPKQVKEYFNRVSGHDVGEHISLLRQEAEEVDISEAVEETSPGSYNHYTVDLFKLPPDVKAIRFSNGW